MEILAIWSATSNKTNMKSYIVPQFGICDGLSKLICKYVFERVFLFDDCGAVHNTSDSGFLNKFILCYFHV